MKIKLLLIGLITLLSKGSLFAQSYEQLPPGGKVNGQQSYILPKTAFVIEIPVATTTLSRKSPYVNYSDLQLKNLQKRYGLDPDKYKKLKTVTSVVSTAIIDDSIKFNIAAVPDYEKIFYISSGSRWNKNQAVTFTYGTDGILTDAESSREDKTFDIIVKGISGLVSIVGSFFKGADGKDLDSMEDPKFKELDDALKNFSKLEMVNNYDVYKDMKATYEKQYQAAFSEIFYTEKKKIVIHKITYTPKKEAALTTEKNTTSIPFFMLNSSAELVFSSALNGSIWGKDIKTENLAGKKPYNMVMTLMPEQQTAYFQARANIEKGIAFNIPQKIDLKISNTDNKTVLHEICKVAQFGTIGYINSKKKAKTTFSLDPVTGELKKLSLEGKAILVDQVGSAATLATDAINTMKGEGYDTKLEKEVKRLENEKKKRDLLKELGVAE